MLTLLLKLLCLIKVAISLKPNVLFIVIDDLKPNLGCFGYKNAYTPNIDKLASKSFIFDNAFAQQALCGPSRVSFLTSRRPDSLHLYDVHSYWRDQVGNFTSLPQHFKENGYYTYSIGKIFHPGKTSNFTDDYPYSWSKIPFHSKTQRYKNDKACPDNQGKLKSNLLCPVDVSLQPDGTLPDIEILNAAASFLKFKENITNKPYFLAVGFHKPHIPFKFPIKYLDYHPLDKVELPSNRWRPSLMPEVAWNPWIDIRKRDDIKSLNITFPFGVIPDDYTKKIIQHYDASISYIDDLIGQLLKQVDNKTIIVLTSDHGFSHGEHGEFSKYSNFDVATKVPLIIYIPNLIKDKIVVKNLVELVDLFPTLVDLSQVSRPIPVCDINKKYEVLCTEGQSMVPILVKAVKKEYYLGKSAVFTQYPRPGTYPLYNSDQPALKDIKIMGYSIRTKRYRYTEWISFNHTNFKPNWSIVYGKELYDHLIDSKEDLNLENRPELLYIIKNLRKKLKLGWRHIQQNI